VVWLLGHVARVRCWPGGANLPLDGTRARSRRALLVTAGVTALAVAALVITVASSGASGIRLR
jgi:hypothetical protein